MLRMRLAQDKDGNLVSRISVSAVSSDASPG